MTMQWLKKEERKTKKNKTKASKQKTKIYEYNPRCNYIPVTLPRKLISRTQTWFLEEKWTAGYFTYSDSFVGRLLLWLNFCIKSLQLSFCLHWLKPAERADGHSAPWCFCSNSTLTSAMQRTVIQVLSKRSPRNLTGHDEISVKRLKRFKISRFTKI